MTFNSAKGILGTPPDAKPTSAMTTSTPGPGVTSLKKPWKRFSDVIVDSVDYLGKRKSGEIKSLKTGWEAFNKIGLNGIEWQSLYVISARPGVGKTLIMTTLARDIQTLNPDQDFAVLHFQFEMLGRNMAVRELSGASGLDIRYLQSAEDDGMPPLDQRHLDALAEYAKKQHGRQEFVIDYSMSVPQMESAIMAFYNEFKKPIVVTLDHTLLVKQSASENTKQQTLQNLATMMTDIKNKIPVTFIVLSQLNREIDDAERQKPGQLSNYPTDADVFGSDYLLQCADVMIAFNRPAKYNLALYGPQRYQIGPHDKNLLAAHILKNRFGTTSIQWYEARYNMMRLIEVPTPPMAPKK